MDKEWVVHIVCIHWRWWVGLNDMVEGFTALLRVTWHLKFMDYLFVQFIIFYFWHSNFYWFFLEFHHFLLFYFHFLLSTSIFYFFTSIFYFSTSIFYFPFFYFHYPLTVGNGSHENHRQWNTIHTQGRRKLYYLWEHDEPETLWQVKWSILIEL